MVANRNGQEVMFGFMVPSADEIDQLRDAIRARPGSTSLRSPTR
jgi:hypothetical protein